MNITVILCTYNRCQSLAKALASAAALRVPESVEWEVLVVDNNSRDQTCEVVREFGNRYPGRFRYLFEPQPGKSYALNSGIREARGTVLAFMDDDVTVEPSWLANLTATLHSGEWAGAGGRVLPEKNFSPPRWLSLTGPRGQVCLAPLALFDVGEQPGQLAEPPFGTNMAFRKEMFEKHGGFRTDLGPRPGSEIRNEDTEFGARLLRRESAYATSPLRSYITPCPLNESRKNITWIGGSTKAAADIRQFGIPTHAWCVLGIPLYLFRRLAVWTLRWMVTLDSARRFHSKLAVWAQGRGNRGMLSPLAK